MSHHTGEHLAIAEETAELSSPVSEQDHLLGSRDAPVVVVEYGDYECSSCGRAYWVVKDLLTEFGDDVAFVFRNYPRVDVHPRAETVAEALEAAGAQGRFWEMHDWFYEHQHQLELTDLEEHAGAIELDLDLWRSDWRDRNYRERVQRDLETGRASGVTSTPTFFINGSRYEGAVDLGSLAGAIKNQVSDRT
jgi:protein-disulfide isomerase